MKSYYIYLIRHGLTDHNLEGRYTGHTDVPLCEDGRKQLRQLAEERIYPYPEALFTSPLLRCQETCRLIYPDIKPLIIADLIEYNFGEFEAKTAEELENHPVFSDWLAGKKGVEPPFGESMEEFSRRVCGCFSSIVEGLMKTGVTRAAVVTHGGVIMTLLSAFGLPECPMHEWMTPNGCGYTVRITPSIWMRGQKLEVVCEIPEEPETENEAGDSCESHVLDLFGEAE